MDIVLNKKLIAIYGPTISQKTGLAVNLAKYIWGKFGIDVELISADSRKVYRDLYIGQVSVLSPFGQKLKVHLAKFLSLDRKLRLYDYKEMAEEAIDKFQNQGKLPILFGGTGIYLLSIMENWIIPQCNEDSMEEEKMRGRGSPKYKILLLIPSFNKQVLFKAIKIHVEKNFQRGIFDELKHLVEEYKLDPLNPEKWNILYETVEYREFLEYANQKQKLLDQFNKSDLMKIKRRIFTDLKDMARRQIGFLPKFGSKNIVSSWQEARSLVDNFLEER